MEEAPSAPSTLLVAAALALGPAVSLGLARFSYALLLPPMRDDLGWSYLTAGAMNTVNAAGYLLGALAVPRLLARVDARRVLLGGSAAAALFLALHGGVTSDALLSFNFPNAVHRILKLPKDSCGSNKERNDAHDRSDDATLRVASLRDHRFHCPGNAITHDIFELAMQFRLRQFLPED